MISKKLSEGGGLERAKLGEVRGEMEKEMMGEDEGEG
jgi:hypothetical protein